MKIYIIQSIVVLTLFLWGCKKDQLPKATSNGANTFGCKINGKLFVPKDAFPGLQGLSVFYEPGTMEFSIFCDEPRTNGLDRHLSIKINQLKIGGNILNDENTSEVSISTDFQLDQNYITNTVTGGMFTVNRLDTAAKIISGTFFSKLLYNLPLIKL